MGNKLGLIGYTNRQSGIGLFIYELWKYLEADSILSINAGIKHQELWTDRQVSAHRPPTKDQLTTYFETFRPDVVLFLETPFSMALYEIAKKYNCKCAGIPMHETFNWSRLNADLLICPCYSAWEKASGNKTLLFLPIGLEMFPFKLRTGHTFISSIGYGGVNDRRQVGKILEAFKQVCNPNAQLIINSQANLPKGLKINDSRVDYRQKTYPEPKDVYAEGDIAILPIAYGGYERPILESMASGLPTLTMNADPMNLFQHDPDFLLEPSRRYKITDSWVVDTEYNEVSVEDLREKMEILLNIPTGKYSVWARAQAVAQSWEGPIDYKSVWLEALESA